MRAWVLQRATAVYLLLYFPYLILTFAADAPADHAALVAWLSRPGVSIGLLLFVVSVLLHSWVGIRDVLIDYVRPLGARIALLAVLGFGLAALGLWALKVVILIHAAPA